MAYQYNGENNGQFFGAGAGDKLSRITESRGRREFKSENEAYAYASTLIRPNIERQVSEDRFLYSIVTGTPQNSVEMSYIYIVEDRGHEDKALAINDDWTNPYTDKLLSGYVDRFHYSEDLIEEPPKSKPKKRLTFKDMK